MAIIKDQVDEEIPPYLPLNGYMQRFSVWYPQKQDRRVAFLRWLAKWLGVKGEMIVEQKSPFDDMTT